MEVGSRPPRREWPEWVAGCFASGSRLQISGPTPGESRDVRDLRVGPTRLPDLYDSALALYCHDSEERQRLPAVAHDGRWLNNREPWGSVQVAGDG